MSTNLIDKMTECEAKSLLNDIASIFFIDGNTRTSAEILACVKNSVDHAFTRCKAVEDEI